MRAWTASTPAAPFDQLPAQPGVVTAYDSARRHLVDVGGAQAGTARMYVCGITPYDSIHIGHANTYVTFDLLNRAWRDCGLGVRYVQNVTDVDDPLLERALATGVEWTALAAEQTELFRTDMAALNVLPPDAFVAATEAIDLVVALVTRLTELGAAYPATEDEADIFFRVESDPLFGSVSHLDPAEARTIFAERGGDPDRPGKKGELDPLLWLLNRPGEPGWVTPFGHGRPGWHVECSAIALEHLGSDFDVQGGGTDLVFPHHEMSASHARVATAAEFARAYLHSGMVGLDGEKMSKSRGNLVLVSRLREQGVDPMAIRLVLLDQHYRSDWTWTAELLADAERRLAMWRSAIGLTATLNADQVLVDVRRALRTDLDAPAALAVIDAWAGASLDIDGDDTYAPVLVQNLCDALLGVRL